MSENNNVEDKVDYAKTLNLPKTSFKMKANLAQKEPLTLRDWKKAEIYEKSLKKGHHFCIARWTSVCKWRYSHWACVK